MLEPEEAGAGKMLERKMLELGGLSWTRILSFLELDTAEKLKAKVGNRRGSGISGRFPSLHPRGRHLGGLEQTIL